MSGHSKWHNRVHRKSRQDAKKGALYSKMGKEVMAAAKRGGPDPQANTALRDAIDRAKSAGVPADNIERAIRRGAGLEEGVNMEEGLYEGYAAGGVAVLLEILTDNRNRTASEVRHIFSRHGGNLGESGSVAWMFKRKGLLVIDREATPVDEEELLLHAAEAGAEDVQADDQALQIVTDVDAFQAVRESLEGQGYTFAEAELTMIPQTEVEVSGKPAEQVLTLVELLEEHDDVQHVYTNMSISDEELARIEV